MLTTEEERRLVKKAQEDIRYFEGLYDHYYLPIFYFVAKRTENKELAGEITSIVFLKALENIKSYTFRGVPFSSWLYRIAQNALTDVYRKNRSSHIIDVSTRQLESIQQELSRGEEEKQIEAILELLPNLLEEEVVLIELRYFDQRKYKEIGEILNITEESARVKVHRVIVKMKAMLNVNL